MKNLHPESEQQKRLRAARRAVVKLGTNIVTGSGGQFNTEHLEPVARTIARLKKEGRQIVLVSSGAVGLGRGRLGLHRDRLNDLVVRQACACTHPAIGTHGWPRSPKPACASERRSAISNWTRCGHCASKRDEIC